MFQTIYGAINLLLHTLVWAYACFDFTAADHHFLKKKVTGNSHMKVKSLPNTFNNS